jgi:membrane protein implicated in regulation of membrane protease activity
LNQITLWWVIAGVLVAVELATGTFYLLMLALGGVAGAMAAHAGLSEPLQIAVASIVGSLCAGGWYARRRQSLAQAAANPMASQNDPTLSLDLGQTVHVDHWHSDGSTHVQYRGASWQARLKNPLAASSSEPGTYRICATQGNQLLLEKA